MPDGAVRRFAFLAGTAEYPAIPHATLTSVRADLEEMRELLVDQLGYEIAGGAPLLNPTSQALRLALSDWFVADERTPEDLVLIYYSGHGLVTRRAVLQLITHDSRMRQLPATALPASELALHFIPEDADGGRLVLPAGVFVIVDTCYAGAGAANVAGMAAELHAQASDATSVFALACARPREEADEGVFTAALSEVLRNESGKLGKTQQELLSALDVPDALNAYFAERGLRQRAELSGVNMRNLAFWPNPRYAEAVPPGLDVEVQEAVRTGAVESGWDRADPAIELARVPGAFTGRETALDELTAWLATPPDRTLRVVTGGPGSGKSTLLREILGDGTNADVAIRARGRTRADVTALMGAWLGVAEDPEGLLAALSERTTRCVIVVDGLDESAEPQATAALFATLAREAPSAKVLVGTRPHLVNLLDPQPTEVVDLDSDQYFDARDIVATIMRRLVQEADSPYRDNPALAITVAEQASARAGHSFLLADLIGGDLAAARQPPRPADLQADMPNVAAALRHELDRFGADRQRVEDLLTPLAHARGKGLPWTTLWPGIATALSGRAYGDGDIAWLLEHAGSYVIEDASDGRSVYRTFHEELARAMRGDDDDDVHGVFTDQLLTALPRRANGAYAWENADPYITRHLATHAARADRIALLAQDPGFLAAAEPQRLLAALASAGEERLSQVVRLAAPRAVGATAPERAAYLELVARQQSLDDLANALDPHELDPPWRCRWARWTPDSPHRVVPTPHIQAYTHPVVELAGRRVVFSGGLDRSVRRWDARSGDELGKAIVPGRGRIVALAVAVSDATVSIAAHRRTFLFRHDVVVLDEEGAIVAGPFRGERSPTWVRMAGGPALVTLSSEEIRVRAFTDGDAVTYSAAPGTRPVRMAAITVSAGLRVVCAHDNGAVTLTRWTRGHVQIRRLRGTVKNPRGVALTASGLVLAWDSFGRLRRWQVDGGRAGPDLTGVTGPLTVASMAGREVLVHQAGLALEVREPSSGELLARLDGHNEPSRSLTSSGAWVVSDDAGTLRIWDLDDPHRRGTVVGHAVQVALRHPDGIRTLAAEGGAILAVDDRGEAAAVIDAPERATQLAALRTSSGDVVAVGMPEGRIGLWRQGVSGGQVEFLGRTPTRDEQSTALALRDRGGAVELLSAGRAPAHIRTWRVPQIRETPAPLDVGPEFTDYAAFHEHDGQTLAATLSDSGVLRVWDVDAARLARGPFALEEGSGDAVALGAFSTGSVLACARSSYDGTSAVLIWGLDDGRLLAEFEAPDNTRISALAPGVLLGRDVVLAGMNTSIVIWNLDAQVVARIELDAAIKAVVLVPPSEFQVATNKGLVSVELRGA